MKDQYQEQRRLQDDQFVTLNLVLAGQKWSKRHNGFTAKKIPDWGCGYEPLKKPVELGGGYAIVARIVS